MFFGGSAGPGKSSALLMGALQYVDTPGTASLILRRNYSQLSQPGALMSRAQEWLAGTDAHWNGQEKTWTFPSGAKLMFGHINHPGDVMNYQSSEFQYIAFDELTGFTEEMYTFLFSRLRRTKVLEDLEVPLRMRAASNPGGNGHQWVRARFVNPESRQPDAVFIPARLEDMPHLDQDAYIESLKLMAPVSWQRLLYGDWDVAEAGTIFHAREWLANRTIDPDETDLMPKAGTPTIRVWDLAATEPNGTNPDPDWTAGVRCSYDLHRRRFVIEHAVRLRKTAGDRDQQIGATILADGKRVIVGVEQERAAAGKAQAAYFKRDLVPDGWQFRPILPTGEKSVRAAPLASMMSQGATASDGSGVWIVAGPWNEWLLDELDAFTGAGETHDDGVDSLAHGFAELVLRGGVASAHGQQVASARLPRAGSGGMGARGVAGIQIGPRR